VNVTDYLRIFRHYWWMLAVFTVVGIVIGYLSWVVNWWIIDFGPKYQSTATLFVATQTGTTTAEAYQNDMFSQQRAVSYAALATSEQVAARAVDQLKSSLSPDDLRAKISAKVRDKTVMLDVSVTDPSPEEAQAYADAVSNQLVQVVSQLETSRRGGTPSAAAVIVDNADYPTKPVGLKLWMRLLLGAAGGLIVGLLAALVTGTLDKRLRGRENIESETGSLVMGALPKDPLRRNAGVVDLSGNGLYAERIRELRTNLRFTVPPGGSSPARCIAVTSPSAGDGRTTTAIDLAAALAESGRSVILVDGDLRNPSVADRLLQDDMRARAMRTGLSTVLVGEDEIGSAAISHVDVGNHTITVLPAGPVPPRPGELWATDRATKLLDYLAGAFDYVVVDTPPLGDYTDGAIVGALGHGAIVLARIGGTTDRALRRAVQVLQAAHVAILGTVVTFEAVSRGAMRAHAKQRGRTVEQPRESGIPVESK
jgi:receptor protein-tyrosine kinase